MTWMTLVVVLAVWSVLSLPVAVLACRSIVLVREARIGALVPFVAAMGTNPTAQ